MGQLKHDGVATQGGLTAPAGVITFGDLYSISGINGIALRSIASTDTVRTLDLEISQRIWYVKIPNAIAALRGSFLYWTDGAKVFQRGDTHLVVAPATAGDYPVAFVEEDVDANRYCAIRVLNGGPVAA